MSVEEQVQVAGMKLMEQSPTLSATSSFLTSSEEGYLSSPDIEDLVENDNSSGDETSFEVCTSSDESSDEEREERRRGNRTKMVSKLRPVKGSPLCDSAASLSQLQGLMPGQLPSIEVSSSSPPSSAHQRSSLAALSLSMRQEAVLRSFKQRRQSDLELAEAKQMLPRIEIEQVGLDEDVDSDAASEEGKDGESEGRNESRERASRRMLSALGRGRPAVRRGQSSLDRRGGRGCTRVPSLDQISSRFAESAPTSLDASGMGSPTPGTPGSAFSTRTSSTQTTPTTPTHSRSFSCPQTSSATFGKVQVFVTPPTPKPQLPSSPSAPASSAVFQSLGTVRGQDQSQGLLLTPPPLEMAPGRSKQLLENQLQQQVVWSSLVNQFWTNAALLSNATVAGAAQQMIDPKDTQSSPFSLAQEQQQQTELYIPRRQQPKRKSSKDDEDEKRAMSAAAAESSNWWRRRPDSQPRQPSTTFRPKAASASALDSEKRKDKVSIQATSDEVSTKPVRKYVPPAKRGNSFDSQVSSSSSHSKAKGDVIATKRAARPVPSPSPSATSVTSSDRVRVAQTMLNRLGQRQAQTAVA